MKVRHIAKRRGAADFGSYAWWFHRKVRASLTDARPTIPHAAVSDKLGRFITSPEFIERARAAVARAIERDRS